VSAEPDPCPSGTVGAAQAADPATVHATCIAIGDRAALIRGRSGAGKSDLALRCLALGQTPVTPVAARLIADDRVALARDGGRLIATAPPSIAGLIEVRGVGIIPVPHAARAEVVVLIDLDSNAQSDRLPDVLPHDELLGVAIPVLALQPFYASSALKVLMAIDTCGVAAVPCQATKADDAT
jgi:HPr kinase/phosphorylase